ncbi:polysaccharide deacetylase family protein [Legionella jamestowniensis]|uniref:Polysaccharide deacetylase n=1 Tax=Legionella jamestowniensis TaxID=455 RepID=A0A0W0UZE0_9GAMM|nr:polysaccharide deacetylase family protein [Legionella jamestowniensis]KTD12998.1 polysaccharide deacetylase [Legionella jamestowniensis]SFL79236.1 Peptidoglycan/xylan/chitin deacetylase, PgdA/CDA1 family [Legionella jamestowniensis DSM 19215]
MQRQMVGYGANPPQILWPNQAKIAINFVLNYEEGAELSPVNGDKFSEEYGGEFPLAKKPAGMRNRSMESLFEYGSRAGLWRLIRLFNAENIPLTFFITGLALTLNPELSRYLKTSSHDLVGHGWRWIDYALIPKEEEKEHILNCCKTIKKLTGKPIQGWYSGRRSENTRDLLLEIGGFLYDSDSYADDLPYFEGKHLIIPYTLDCNDFRFSTSPGFSHGDMFFMHLKNTLDYLYREQRPAIMTIGLHARISGHPGRCMAVKQFIDYLQQFPDVWITRRIDIAHYWIKQFSKPM